MYLKGASEKPLSGGQVLIDREIQTGAIIAKEFLGHVRKAPTIEAKPVVHGEWEPSPHLYGYVRCSECHDCNVWGEWIDGKKWNFCPNCGADMRGET